MRSFLTFLAALPAVFAAPLEKRQSAGDLIPNSWIVTLNEGASDSLLQSTITQVGGILGTDASRTYNFGSFKGFSIQGRGDVTTLLANVASIDTVEQDSVATVNELVSQEGAPYGLVRISHQDEEGASNYIYDSSAGDGTYAYIIDTGIYVEHNDFGGRAVRGATFVDDESPMDMNGHGTHVAGTTGSMTYGVAKKTNLIAVKVIGADGSGAVSNILAGIDFAVNDAKSKGRIGKAVGNLSLGGLFSPTTNAAVREAVNQGLFLAVAAGNSGLPTITSSPASEPSVCTIGAIDDTNMRASFSNFGVLVDVFAPGVDIISTWIDGPNDTNIISGTSMSTPHVTGLGAYLLALEGAMGAQELCSRIKTLSTKGQIPVPLSANRIAYNGNGA